ncbi:abortive infection system antitoxin AbiGi family protein [Neisseria animaloris]|uniref:abortive infection system antitoxin AbiGi family protein n=1 Tax=Neisseria animaloris TaxID=326522 RepID=UPI0018FFE17F|nr:abortive infection system antitoxin AbiGi family protein [Neisseria animaloris]
MIRNRPDFSNYLAHFTTDRKPCSQAKNNATAHVIKMSAQKRLVNILRSKKILASRLPWNSRDAVCLTECPWESLLDHAKRYSSYGIGFNKPFVFGAGGGPAYYVRADHYQNQKWDDNVHTFVTPFWPAYRPQKLKNNQILNNKNIDYSHEREWRVPHDLAFEYDHIEFIILNTYEDMAKFPKDLKDDIGRNKFLLMDNYRQIGKIWPTYTSG